MVIPFIFTEQLVWAGLRTSVSLSSSCSILTLTLPGNIPLEIMGLYRVGVPKVK